MTYIPFARAGEQRQKDNEEKTVEPDTKKEQQKCIF
jgi:hypothetical protein